VTGDDFYFNYDEFLKGAEISDRNMETDDLIRKLSDSYWECYKGESLGSLKAELVSLSKEQRKGLMLVMETLFKTGFLLGYSECETRHNPYYKPCAKRILKVKNN